MCAFALSPLLVGLDASGRRAATGGRSMKPEAGKIRPRQLLVDVSELVRFDKKTGIPRVVRSVLVELLTNEPEGYRVEPVYAGISHGYLYARRFTTGFLGYRSGAPCDDPVDVAAGDVFWGLDWQAQIVPQQRDQFASWQREGVRVVFTVYDLLPLIMPESTFPAVSYHHARWLETIARADGLLAISRSVMNDLRKWLTLFGGPLTHEVKLGWAHLGADLGTPLPSRSRGADIVFREWTTDSIPSFLMVGTIEPRKGHAQTLDAFERLWAAGLDARLVIIGKPGWKTEALAQRLRGHAEAGRRLLWFDGAGDDDLEAAYQNCNCLIAASLNEGFGLPLIEAAMRGLPILARDLPVFREVAGEHAAYFSGDDAESLAAAICSWLDCRAAGDEPRPELMPWLTWSESVRKMLDCVLHGQWHDIWRPQPESGLIARFWGSDPRLDGGGGVRVGTRIIGNRRAEPLVAGRFGSLSAGAFEVIILGEMGAGGNGGVEALIFCCSGEKLLGRARITASVQEKNGVLARIPFHLETARNDVEIRVTGSQHTDISVGMVEIHKAKIRSLGSEAVANTAATAGYNSATA
ncbi:MAG: hypothetical protein B7Z59_00690 [Acidiphilium sp. 37-67-22]|nr:MAG: hypothetical protein B7Z59_00690 [Acidiphilium sp. 37-67-22]